MACVYCRIKDLTMNSHSFFINALVIGKTEKKIVNAARDTCVITFTVRDTKDHFINCSIWGTEQYIENCVRAYRIGDIISIYQPMVLMKNSNSNYHPRTTSPFELRVNEGKAYIHRINDEQHSQNLLQLRKRAIKPTSIALNLDDLNIGSHGSDMLTADLVVVGRNLLAILIVIVVVVVRGFQMRKK